MEQKQDQQLKADTPGRPTVAPLLKSIILIGCWAAVGFGFVKLLTVDWILRVLAGVFNFFLVLFSFGAIWLSYRLQDKSTFPKWVRLTVAIIIGMSVGTVAYGLTHSHKFTRYMIEESESNEG